MIINWGMWGVVFGVVGMYWCSRIGFEIIWFDVSIFFRKNMWCVFLRGERSELLFLLFGVLVMWVDVDEIDDVFELLLLLFSVDMRLLVVELDLFFFGSGGSILLGSFRCSWWCIFVKLLYFCVMKCFSLFFFLMCSKNLVCLWCWICCFIEVICMLVMFIFYLLI